MTKITYSETKKGVNSPTFTHPQPVQSTGENVLR